MQKKCANGFKRIGQKKGKLLKTPLIPENQKYY